MSKNSKRRRDRKKFLANKKTKPSNQSEKQSPKIAPDLYRLPNPFQNIPHEKLDSISKSIGQKNEEDFQKSLAELIAILKEYEPKTLLSVITTYGLSNYITENGVQKTDSDFKIGQAHVEILQALSLTINPKEMSRYPCGPDTIHQTWMTLKQLMQAFDFSDFGSISVDSDEESKQIRSIQQKIRHETQMVRNWGYFGQMQSIALELFAPLDKYINSDYQYNPADVVNTFKAIMELSHSAEERRITFLRDLWKCKTKNNLIKKYYNAIGSCEGDGIKFLEDSLFKQISFKELFELMMSHYDLHINTNHQYSIMEIANKAKIKPELTTSILNDFSLTWGDLNSLIHEHLFLANPTWNKPLIKISEDKYFCSIPQLFFSFVFPNLERLYPPNNLQHISERRAEYLEDKIKQIVTSRFPSANTLSQLHWDCNGVKGETDLVTFIDSSQLLLKPNQEKSQRRHYAEPLKG